MLKKYYLTNDDIPVCKVESSGGIRFYAMNDRLPVLINPVYILPGYGKEVTEEEFLKYANPGAVEYLKEYS